MNFLPFLVLLLLAVPAFSVSFAAVVYTFLHILLSNYIVSNNGLKV